LLAHIVWDESKDWDEKHKQDSNNSSSQQIKIPGEYTSDNEYKILIMGKK